MLPREIQSENWPDRAKYDLPIRPIGALHWLGILPMAFSVAFISIPAKFGWQFLQRALHAGGGAFEWGAVVFLSLFIVAGVIPFRLGLFILAGRVRLVVTKETFIVTEVAGPFRWSRKFRAADIERLEVGSRNAANQTSARVPAGLMQLGGLVAVLRSGPKRLVLLGYPADWLSALAGELSEALRRGGAAVPVEEVRMPLGATTPAAEEESLTQPPQSTARLVTTVGGIELTVPSRGIFKESAGLIWMGIFWCGVLSAISFAVLFGGLSSKGHHSLGQVGTILVFGLFWAMGLGLLCFGIHLGTRRWTLRADKSSLHAALHSALRNREWQWSAAEIEKIQAGYSNVEVNNRRLEELQVHSRAGNKTGLLAGRDHAELVWMATAIRQALGLTTASKTIEEVTTDQQG
jgi:hypothetical protein